MSPVILRSRFLADAGIPHAFTTREGGVSEGMFRSLSFGNPSNLAAPHRDPPENIAENWRRTLDACGLGGRELVQVHQVHGADVRIVRRAGPSHSSPDGSDTRADALLTDDPARAIAVRTADCAPVLIATGDGAVVAAVHAGWRGVVLGVAVRAVLGMRTLGAQRLIAAIGPCIGPERFEIGPEVVAEFDRAFPGLERAQVLKRSPDGKGRADLKCALRLQLTAAGVEAVEIIPGCTASEPSRFHSHRSASGLCGRMAAVIGPRAGSAPH